MDAASRFDICLPLLLKEEGGYVDNKRDPGGATNYGITQAVASAWGVDDVHDLTPATVRPIYLSAYWHASMCDSLPTGVDRLVFDSAVNCGTARARRWLQVAAGVKADGVIGPKTLEAVSHASPKILVAVISSQRKAFYQQDEDFDEFGRGWLARLAEVTALASSEASPLPTPKGT